VNHGTVHEYLGMTIDFSMGGKVKFIMNDYMYVEVLIDEIPEEFTGHAATPAANHLCQVNYKAEKLNDENSEKFHHLTAKLLYLSKRARPDLQTAVAFYAITSNNRTSMIGRNWDDVYIIFKEARSYTSH
jgi:hypothetical protein